MARVQYALAPDKLVAGAHVKAGKAMATHGRLVVVSNRVPTLSLPATEDERRAQPVGGLVSALRSALERKGGIWFGWSGRIAPSRPSDRIKIADIGQIQLRTMDLSRDEVNLFYTLFANRTLWPLLHNHPAHVVIRHEAYRSYRRVNRKFADTLFPSLQSDDIIWVHDYHLIPLGQELRRLGWKGKIGFFLHTPFPPAESFAMLPWSDELLECFLAYDLAGFHTKRYAFNLTDAMEMCLGGSAVGQVYTGKNGELRVAAHPIGIDPVSFKEWASTIVDSPTSPLPPQIAAHQQVVLGVDRLDYTKGIPDRLRVFENLLERHRPLRGKVTMVQISAPSRSRVPEYIQERDRVDQLVGRINGRFSDAGWLPVHYLYRSYSQIELAGFFRQANVCLVTPLRDGMNLVAKEFVASQGENPGVLVLSKFCGAADTMPEALIVNPYDIEETTAAVYRALTMPRKERERRWEALILGVTQHTAQRWGETFLADLVAA